MSTLLHNAEIVNEGCRFRGYIVISGDKITEVTAGSPAQSLLDDTDIRKIDIKGDLLMPGVIDTHVHFRDPGLTAKGDIATESRAAVAGGVTSYLDMPNTRPATVTIGGWEEKMARAAGTSAANYGFFIGATNDNIDTLLAADYTRVPGIKLFMGSSTGNMLVDSGSSLERIFAETDTVIAVHAEDEPTIRRNRLILERELAGLPVPIELHSLVRSRQACLETSRHAVELARRHNARLHLLHISTAEELSLLECGDIGDKRITAETCPHYLTLTVADYATRGARIKCNPAIKTGADRVALTHALAERRIDVIATDHAPHLPADKEGDLFQAASGMPGVQFSLQRMLEIAPAAKLDATDVVRLMCHNPARLYRMDRRGFLRPGFYADIVRVHRLDPPGTIDDSHVLSRCGWTPYAGDTSSHTIATTWVNGCVAYSYGKIADTSAGRPLGFTPESR